MTREQRLRRVALLCIHFTRNLAYSRAVHKLILEKKEGDFWITIQGDCLDVAVLEWCKLFVERNEKHSWNKIVHEPDKFKGALIKELKINENEWKDCLRKIKAYRDGFVAHLDSEETMQLPQMDLAYNMVIFYFNKIMSYEDETNIFKGIPTNLEDYYENSYSEAASRTKT